MWLPQIHEILLLLNVLHLCMHLWYIFKKTKYRPTYVATSTANIPDPNEALSSTILPETTYTVMVQYVFSLVTRKECNMRGCKVSHS